MKLKSFKQKIKKYDFLLILVSGFVLSILLYCNYFNFKDRVGAYIFSIISITLSIILSNIRYKFIYGEEKYREMIKENFLQNSNIKYQLPPKKTVILMIFFGSTIIFIINLLMDKWFNCILVIIFALLSILILIKKIDKHNQKMENNSYKKNCWRVDRPLNIGGFYGLLLLIALIGVFLISFQKLTIPAMVLLLIIIFFVLTIVLLMR